MMRKVDIETTEKNRNIEIEEDNILGSGWGSEVHKINVIDKSESLESIVAEKRYNLKGLKGIISRVLYGLIFQAPFPYEQNHSAIRSAFYRRKTLKILTDYWRLEDREIPVVADAYYTRWEKGLQTFCLGTEYIDGKPATPLEIDNLVEIMESLNSRLLDAGFIGSAWQAEPGSKLTGVATQNFLNKEGKWYWVDIESGVIPPSFKYLREGIRLGTGFVFDDVDAEQLVKYAKENLESIEQHFGRETATDLVENIFNLCTRTNEWKQREVAPFRHGLRIFTDKEFRRGVSEEYLSEKLRNNLIEEESANLIREKPVRYIKRAMYVGINDFLTTFAKRRISQSIYDWQNSEILTDDKARELESYVNSTKVKGYLQDVGVQFFTAALTPPGLTEIVLTGMTAGAAIATKNPEWIIPAGLIYLGPSIIRSSYSTARFLADSDRRGSHTIAALSSLLKIIPLPGLPHLLYYGTHAPFMGKKNSEIVELSKFLSYKEIVSRAGRITPIFGGEGTRLWNTLLEKTQYHDWLA